MDFTHRIYNKISDRFIYKIAYFTTPNSITIFNFFFTLIYAGYLFSRGTYVCNLLALGIMGISVFLDYLDGDLAKKTNRTSALGAWLDKGGDIVLQISIMAAIAYGLMQGFKATTFPLLAAIMVYFVGRNASGAIAYEYNHTFGFDSYAGSAMFRKYMDEKPTLLNRALKNIIDPTSSAVGLFLFTVRYWIIFGAVFDLMRFAFYSITLLTTIQWIIMYVLYALHLKEYKKLWVLQALAVLDKEREEYYRCRKLTLTA